MFFISRLFSDAEYQIAPWAYGSGLQPAGAFGPISSATEHDKSTRKTAAKATRDRLRDELRELFPELGNGHILKAPVAKGTRRDKDRHAPSDRPSGS
ncbi:MAG: hypothetical protein AAF825_12935 [Pseudomonadota bacterium]